MSKASGVEIRAAAKKATTWGTPVACGAADGVLLTMDTLKKTIENHPDGSLGQPFVKQRDQGEIKTGGAMNAFLRYDGLDLLLALVMGTTEGAPTQQGATAAYAQTFTLKDALDGLFGTIAINKGVNVFEYPSAKIMGFTLKGEMGKPVGIDFDVVADNEDPASATNDLTSFANVTIFEPEHRVLMSQAVFRMNDESGDAIDDGDKVYPSSFELSFKRKLKGDYVVGGANKINEPLTEDTPEVKLKLTFPRYSATTYLSDLGADTRKKLDIVFTGKLIEDTYYRTFNLQFPHLALLNAEAATSRGIVEHPLEFDCLATDTAPTGMAGITKPFQLDVTNRQTADVLA